jgi:hypothetical protein
MLGLIGNSLASHLYLRECSFVIVACSINLNLRRHCGDLRLNLVELLLESQPLLGLFKVNLSHLITLYVTCRIFVKEMLVRNIS